ncbi:pitrilysin family protein [Cyanobium sp. FACHB-13342]|uniref:M16 family metallopeptidase n=1 Tax=Cyanobium sp. FACHB-13342 TaxID=2692793 RepID=UPI001680FF56|nr:pitrilysin family protein [Cyanobium sp. FACHB-13342]MBD2423233.1 insulinase family protein [Cyanobium sp. FACHB-13342]
MSVTLPPPWPWHQTNLPGGLPLIWQSRPGPAIVATRLWIRGGSSEDRPGQRGAAQLLAGLMTRGCGHYGAEALADLVEGRGAALRCEANEDSLVLSLKCASGDAPDLLPLLLAMVREPWIQGDQLELERGLNLQSLQRQREDPFQLAHDQLRSQLYGQGPYGHDPLGVEEELANLQVGPIRELVPSLGGGGALLVACGDVDGDLAALFQDELHQTPWATSAPRPGPGPEAPACTQRFASLEQDTEQLVVMLGAATVPLGDPDGLALRLLQAHLGMGMSSRLFVSLREERGLAYDVGVHLPARRGATPFIWHLSTSADRAEEAVTALLEEWQRMLDDPLSAGELDLAKAKFRGQDAMGRQTCGQIADRQALVLGHGLGWSYVADTLLRAHQLSADDLMAAARRQLAAPALSLCGPPMALEAGERAWCSHALSR